MATNDLLQEPVPASRRRVVIDTIPQRKPQRRQRKRNNAGSSADTGPGPLEMTPVMQAVREYARRTHSIGALQGAHALKDLVDSIRSLGPLSEDMQIILDRGERAAEQLRSYVLAVYDS